LGYDLDPGGQRLAVNAEEAERVRAIFALFLEYQSLPLVVRELEARGWTNKRWRTRSGKDSGGDLHLPHSSRARREASVGDPVGRRGDDLIPVARSVRCWPMHQQPRLRPPPAAGRRPGRSHVHRRRHPGALLRAGRACAEVVTAGRRKRFAMGYMARKRRGRGEGLIRERDDGAWEARESLGYDNDGKRITRSVYGKTKGEVQEKLRKLQNDAAGGRLAEPATVTVGQYLDSWLKDTAQPKCSPTTFARYDSEPIRLTW
jgi:hypothetical protein